MEGERARLIDVQKRYTNLVSLHRTLPSEIWSEIFLWTLWGAFDDNAFDASGFIWQLSHVCQRWRNIALALTSFWSALEIQFPVMAQREGDVKRLETVIQRSHQGLLHVSFSDDIPDLYCPLNPSIQKCILDNILAESHRWQELEISDYGGTLNMVYASLPIRLPRLESVVLHCSQLIDPREQSGLSVFQDCPRLTKLTLSGKITLDVKFPWHQITELNLICLKFDGGEEERRACLRVIGQCPSLEILLTPYWDSKNDEAYIPISCSNVYMLEVKSPSVIDALTLPSLREVGFHPEPAMPHYDTLYAFQRLLIRSNCSNHTLHSLLSQTHSLTFLALVVNVQQLDDESDVSDQDQIVTTLEFLQVVSTKTVTFLPLLSSLVIEIHQHPDSSLDYFRPVGRFASMLKARWSGDATAGLARLRSFYFAVQAQHPLPRRPFARLFDEEEGFLFKELVDDGMDLTIQVTSDLAANGGGNNTVIAIPR
ncbi:hypothetical protein CPB85DRAFT_1309915 [Mucidula mucida]|nr:hypothetical protein CPB85DRAFT_1309915 [Mucidula mucida]